MPKTQEEYIAYRIERAWRTFNDAKSLAEARSWNSSINRLYYACFYAVLALFAKHDINSHTHSGVKTQFLLLFIKTEKLDKSLGILYSDLFDFRQKGDYGDFFDFEEENVITLIPEVDQFIKEIETLTKQ
ncbi:MAG: HEPN domain-containing protein [Bacteroidetes bacterium]|nr:HEPN domain-containing protein [Bacteroidota bacterium]